MTILDRTAGAALGLAATAAIVWGSNAPITVHGSDQAICVWRGARALNASRTAASRAMRSWPGSRRTCDSRWCAKA